MILYVWLFIALTDRQVYMISAYVHMVVISVRFKKIMPFRAVILVGH